MCECGSCPHALMRRRAGLIREVRRCAVRAVAHIWCWRPRRNAGRVTAKRCGRGRSKTPSDIVNIRPPISANIGRASARNDHAARIPCLMLQTSMPNGYPALVCAEYVARAPVKPTRAATQVSSAVTRIMRPTRFRPIFTARNWSARGARRPDRKTGRVRRRQRCSLRSPGRKNQTCKRDCKYGPSHMFLSPPTKSLSTVVLPQLFNTCSSRR